MRYLRPEGEKEGNCVTEAPQSLAEGAYHEIIRA